MHVYRSGFTPPPVPSWDVQGIAPSVSLPPAPPSAPPQAIEEGVAVLQRPWANRAWALAGLGLLTAPAAWAFFAPKPAPHQQKRELLEAYLY